MKDNKIYIIDFGFSKEINQKFIKKVGAENPNVTLMLIGFILKLKELNFDNLCWKYLKQYVSQENIDKFKID